MHGPCAWTRLVRMCAAGAHGPCAQTWLERMCTATSLSHLWKTQEGVVVALATCRDPVSQEQDFYRTWFCVREKQYNKGMGCRALSASVR